jgi:hypothetical protein
MDCRDLCKSWGARVGFFLVAAVYFAGSLILMNRTWLFVSPDETANVFFAGRFCEDFSLRLPSGISGDNAQMVHPRSVVVIDGEFAPGSFLGLPVIYGFACVLFGEKIFWFLTPLLTIAAALCLRKILCRYTSSSVGWISSALFLLHPAVWYYSARGMMHNVLFVDLLVFCIWLWITKPLKRFVTINDLLVGLVLASAIFVRTSEFAWIAGVILFSACVWRHSLSFRRMRTAFLGLALGLSVVFTANYLTYGHPFANGYTVSQAPLAMAQEISQTDVYDSVDILPFGFHPRDAWNHFSEYSVSMFWWMSVLSVLGFFVLLSSRKHKRDIRGALLITIAVSAWLALMYGSWEIHDNPDTTQITMANSYIRYWLPIYLFSVPLSASAIVWLSNFGRNVVARGIIIVIFVAMVAHLNINTVFLKGQDGLFKMRRELAQSAQIQESVFALTPENSIIIVDRADKLFFPRRNVVYPLRSETTYAAMPSLVFSAPLYYYGITLPQQDVEYLNSSKLKEKGLSIELIKTYDNETLYHIFAN